MPHKDPEERRKWDAQYRKRNKDRLKKYHAQWRADNAEHVRETGRVQAKKWRKANPDKVENIRKIIDEKRKRTIEVTCRSYLRKQIYRGKLKRGRCHCGKIGQAHHKDYSKPLAVTWFCALHHAEHHRELKKCQPA